MAENKLADLSMDFAVSILKVTDGIKGHYSLINQLERSATSIGANIREAKYAHSKADFISKLQIALKECYLRASDFDYKIYSSVLTITFICATILLNIISSEYEALFSDKPNELNDWKIISVNEFENS